MTQRAQTYQGKPCKKCASTLRYRSCRMCVACLSQDPPARDRYHRDVAKDVRHHKAIAFNTYLALAYPEELERRGWRQVGIGVSRD